MSAEICLSITEITLFFLDNQFIPLTPFSYAMARLLWRKIKIWLNILLHSDSSKWTEFSANKSKKCCFKKSHVIYNQTIQAKIIVNKTMLQKYIVQFFLRFLLDPSDAFRINSFLNIFYIFKMMNDSTYNSITQLIPICGPNVEWWNLVLKLFHNCGV